ncbi:hypothetical protein MTX26_04560 [Bradyrhizobium sp. ISRA443]|uniref:hypothetical protein n=1 Tax=unclassified Bradyrhizobium TaxID=2631580 RepID=UPI002478D4C2|nr:MULTISPECIES: hypothetical protein [unclassified Bradyrhizobium]WGS00132.1 hypothetical protein MTX23_04560 [Bradyrhizobium sp. ISRA436]WGS07021.1 hypothetical protein MTX18_04560 [Bradyrhizobium sp. ISRA437]WGS13904.1 hypothetical protein MTX26_04560 [Bradyrhizobium sp. ISRA443]
MSISITSSVTNRSMARGLVPLCAGAGVYLFFLFAGEILLRDSDSMWQIKVGQWILEHGAVPYTDVFSFTKYGEAWISSSWLSQVLLAITYGPGDWAGPVILSSIAIGATITIFLYLLSPYFDSARSILIAALALLQSASHFFARPHVLALPCLLAFIGGLMSAADRRTHPSWLLLPLMTLWANLHGGFVLGLALIGPIGLEAIWSAEPNRRIQLAVRWALFGIAALVASCVTPYGWDTLLGAFRILSLGKLLSLIWEWMPVDFSKFTFFEATLLALIGVAFYRKLTLSVPRILLLVGLIWMALTHVRNIEVFALLAPLVLAKPIAEQWGTAGNRTSAFEETRSAPLITILAAIAILIGGTVSTKTFAAHHPFLFNPSATPVAAVDLLQKRGAQRVFSTAPFGGYLVTRDMKVFIDGRAELYGEQYVLDYFDATEARDVGQMLGLLDKYRIDATLLNATSPMGHALDHVQGWKRIYKDDVAVIHVRSDEAAEGAPPAAEKSN